MCSKSFFYTGVSPTYPSTEEITNGLTQQLNLWENRLNGETINPSAYLSISDTEDAYYKTNPTYNDNVTTFEDTMDGKD